MHTFAFKIQCLGIGLVFALSIAFLLIFSKSSRDANTESLISVSTQTMNYLTTDVQKELMAMTDVVSIIASFMHEVPQNILKNVFVDVAKTNPAIYDLYYGSALSRWKGGFCVFSSDWKPYEDPESADWDQIERPWFTDAVKSKGSVIITDPYMDAETKRLVFSIAQTATNSKGEMHGVVAADVFLDVLDSIVSAKKITEDGQSFLLDAAGLYLTSDKHEKILNKNFFEDLGTSFSKEKVLTGKEGVFMSEHHYLAVAPLRGTNWFIVSKGSLEVLDKSSIAHVWIAMAIAMVLAIIISILFARLMSRRIGKTLKTIDIMSYGDLTKRFDETHRDEIGKMSKHLNKFANMLSGVIRSINDDVLILNKSSGSLNSVSDKLIKSSENTAQQISKIAGNTETMANHIGGIASGSEQVSVNARGAADAVEAMSNSINSVLQATNGMNSSIGQISSNAATTAGIAQKASKKSEHATEAMNKLGAAAKEIGAVTDIIKKIADKTNLLALNATIEAASAGEAGKGFAVVAGEIKELANQSAKSADDIAQKIEGIQKETSDAVNVIHEVSGIIGEINKSVIDISEQVEQQTKSNIEITNNIEQANSGVKTMDMSIKEVAARIVDISNSVNEVSVEATKISGNLKSVNEVTSHLTHNAELVKTSSTDLSVVSDELNEILKKFTV